MRFSFIFLILLLSEPTFSQEYNLIPARQEQVTDTFFNVHIIKDNYRWLEKTDSPETIEWIAKQNEMSGNWLKKAERETNSFNEIDKNRHFRYNFPKKEGKYFFSFAFTDTRVGSSLLINTSRNKKTREILIDPYNDISRKDKINISGYQVSKNAELLAYQFTRNGSDWHEVGVVRLPSGKHLKDHLEGIKFSGLAWHKNGFFYSVFEQEGKFGPTSGQKVFYHKIGNTQEMDELIFERPQRPWVNFDFTTTSDERFFMLTETDERNDKVSVFYKDFNSHQPFLRPLITNFDRSLQIIDSRDGKFIALISDESGSNRVVEIDPAKPLQWREIVPPFSEGVLMDVAPYIDRMVLTLQSNNHPILLVMGYDGTVLHQAKFPFISSIHALEGEPEDDMVRFILTSWTVPPVVYEFNIKSFEKEIVERTEVPFDFEQLEYTELEYQSEEGVHVPLVLVHKKKVERDGKNPVLLSAYGGFGTVSTPSYRSEIIHFVEHGGIFAFANIRGGGDKGPKWAKAGKGQHKQNSFDDFIAAAEYLIDQNYTNPDFLAATGGSNGGLVVAAAATQRPDLFKAVVPVVAPTDMIRFEQFTVGHWHNDEYGTATDSASFCRLKDYSPFHNIKEKVNYPSMLVVTSENDDRVPPFHSYKFVARLQNREAQTNSILLKVEEKAGHYGGMTYSSSIQKGADVYSFIMHELGME
ncbi:prolyl oligopeptidase family serine peptidase [Marinilabilia sp.]|uniref:prolyl oligopeptidase family serine peptidase n=1 Tax=Marinilabilia sp. TaxID=2021252 RepID=UPI0025C2E8F1|nr:prolyl oligopeptidase family serine peptidase [Marinilabilia sp.]